MFGDKVKRFRIEHGYSMDKFCELFNARFNAKLNKSNLSRYENGLQEPMISTVKSFADFMGVSVEDLAEVEIINLSPIEKELLESFRSFSPEKQQTIVNLLKTL